MKERIIKCIEENGIEVCADGTILELNSLKFIATIVSLEDEFDIEFPDEYLTGEIMESIDSIYGIITNILCYKE